MKFSTTNAKWPSEYSCFNITATEPTTNVSTANNISGITLDYTPPAISNVIFNHGTTYDSAFEGANTAIVPFSFEASDLSKVTHYKISSQNVEPFTVFKTPTAQTTSVAINTTIDLDNVDDMMIECTQYIVHSCS